MKAAILQTTLCKRHREAGLYLDEPDDHTLHLKRGDEVLASWYAPSARIKDIWRTADQFV